MDRNLICLLHGMGASPPRSGWERYELRMWNRWDLLSLKHLKDLHDGVPVEDRWKER